MKNLIAIMNSRWVNNNFELPNWVLRELDKLLKKYPPLKREGRFDLNDLDHIRNAIRDINALIEEIDNPLPYEFSLPYYLHDIPVPQYSPPPKYKSKSKSSSKSSKNKKSSASKKSKKKSTSSKGKIK